MAPVPTGIRHLTEVLHMVRKLEKAHFFLPENVRDPRVAFNPMWSFATLRIPLPIPL